MPADFDSARFKEETFIRGQKIYIDCVAGEIAPGPKLIGVADLKKQIDKATSALVKKSEPAGVWVTVDQVNNDGSIVIKPEVVSRAEDHEWEPLFSLSERLGLRETAGGLRAEMLNVRRLPNEQ